MPPSSTLTRPLTKLPSPPHQIAVPYQGLPFQRLFPISRCGNPPPPPFIPQTALFPWRAWPLVLSVSRPPAGGSRVPKVVGRGAALGTDNPGSPKGGRRSPPPGWPLPHLRRPCPPRPTPLTVFTEETAGARGLCSKRLAGSNELRLAAREQ